MEISPRERCYKRFSGELGPYSSTVVKIHALEGLNHLADVTEAYVAMKVLASYEDGYTTLKDMILLCMRHKDAEVSRECLAFLKTLGLDATPLNDSKTEPTLLESVVKDDTLQMQWYYIARQLKVQELILSLLKMHFDDEFARQQGKY